jgi:hypothetical protein
MAGEGFDPDPDSSRESRTLRGRGLDARVEADRLDALAAPLPGPTLVETKSLGAYPTLAARFYACSVVDVDGAEAENNAVSFSTSTGTIYVANAGTGVPPAGTKMMAFPIGGRNIAIYNG